MTDDDGWFEAVRRSAEEPGDEFDLSQLQPGDRLRIVTKNTTYIFLIEHDREARLEPGRADRPAGRVLLQGCAFGDSASIKPDHLFCGGSLEFTFDAGRMTQRTSPIREICLLRRSAV